LKPVNSSTSIYTVVIEFNVIQEKKDLQDRLNASNGIIQGLEQKIKQMERQMGSDDVPGMLQRLRDQHAAELKR